MSKIVLMTSTVGELTNGQTYRVRSRTAELLAQQSKLTISQTRRTTNANEGKKGG